MERTKKVKDIYLLGPLNNDKLSGHKLPSKKQVLGRFLYVYVNENKTMKEISTAVIQEVVQFLGRSRIPI